MSCGSDIVCGLVVYVQMFLSLHCTVAATVLYVTDLVFPSASVVFQGDIQQLLILEDPHIAANYCVNYIPDCDSPLPYNSQVLKLQEVSGVINRRQSS